MFCTKVSKNLVTSRWIFLVKWGFPLQLLLIFVYSCTRSLEMNCVVFVCVCFFKITNIWFLVTKGSIVLKNLLFVNHFYPHASLKKVWLNNVIIKYIYIYIYILHTSVKRNKHNSCLVKYYRYRKWILTDWYHCKCYNFLYHHTYYIGIFFCELTKWDQHMFIIFVFMNRLSYTDYRFYSQFYFM